ncbi:MAG: beta-lactamase family protein, partial [Bacteroidales bacterium]|nr:beta-lactamase family protein [Bacteroidales bacterium]
MKNIILMLLGVICFVTGTRAADVVCLNNSADFLPMKDVSNVAIWQVGGIANHGFVTRAKCYAHCEYFYSQPTINDYRQGLQKIKGRNVIILITSELPTNIARMINTVAQRQNCCVASINGLASLLHIQGKTMIHASGKPAMAGEMAARAVFGGIHVNGTLKQRCGPYRKGSGVEILPCRLQYITRDEEPYLRWNYRDTIDSIVNLALDSACFPGCQIFAAKNGKVLINKAYGRSSYGDSCHRVNTDDIYDIASLTKISATTILAMYLHGKGLLDVENSLGQYIRDTVEESPVMDVSIRSLLEHRSGIYAYPPTTRFSNLWAGWRINARVKGINPDTMKSSQLRELSINEIYTPYRIPGVSDIRVADGLWMKNNYQDSLRYFFMKQKMNKRKKYQYSDVNMIYMQWVNEKLLKSGTHEFLSRNFYGPLGMQTTGYLPLTRFPASRIIPTEAHQWTGRMLQGDVHDPAAAFLGGVAGNAGIFSSAKDLAILYQMLINGGEYGRKRYLEKVSVKFFSAKQPKTIRGLGYDIVPS